MSNDIFTISANDAAEAVREVWDVLSHTDKRYITASILRGKGKHLAAEVKRVNGVRIKQNNHV